jgi:hypothetical protein
MFVCASEFFFRSFKERRVRTFDSKTCDHCRVRCDSPSASRATIMIFSKPGVSEILNLQPRGSLAKPYQVKQVRAGDHPV